MDLIETIEGRGRAPSLVLALIERLPDDSLTVALASGNRETFGFGRTAHMLADLYDAINVNTRASGNWGKSGPPKIPPYPRPEGVSEEEKKPKTVADVFKMFAVGKH